MDPTLAKKTALDHADYTAHTREHELLIDHEYPGSVSALIYLDNEVGIQDLAHCVLSLNLSRPGPSHRLSTGFQNAQTER